MLDTRCTWHYGGAGDWWRFARTRSYCWTDSDRLALVQWPLLDDVRQRSAGMWRGPRCAHASLVPAAERYATDVDD